MRTAGAQGEADQTGAASGPVHPRTKRQYAAIPMSKGRTLYGHAEALQQRGLKVSTRFDVLGDDENDDAAGDEEAEERPPQSGTIDLTKASDQGIPDKPKIDAATKADLHLMKAKPPKVQATPQLLAWKQRERYLLFLY
jgi:hypothetical protein